MRTRTTMTIGAAALLVGALGAAPASQASDDAGDVTLGWEAADCRFTIVIVPADREDVQPHVPEGFTPILPDEPAEMLPPDPRLEAVVGFETFQCASHTVDGDVAEDVAYASVWTFVEPPEEYADPDHPLTFVKWETLIPDDDQRDLLTEHDVHVRAGTADQDDHVTTPVGAGYDVSFTLDPDGITYGASGVSPNPVDFGGAFVEYSPHPDGLVAWRTDFAAVTAFGGVGVAQWSEDALAAEILGTTEAQAYVVAGEGLAFDDGSITIPGPARNDETPAADGPADRSARPAADDGRALPDTGATHRSLGAAAFLAASLVRRGRVVV